MLILCPLFHKDSWHFCQEKLPACPWAQPLGWLGWLRCCKQAECECALLLAKFTQGDYLFSPRVEFQGQSPQLAVERLRTTDPAIGELPTGSRVFTCETFSQAAWLHTPSLSFCLDTRGFRWDAWVRAQIWPSLLCLFMFPKAFLGLLFLPGEVWGFSSLPLPF